MNILKRLITVICLTAFLICVSAGIKARADAWPAAYEILNNVPGIDLTSITHEYENLYPTQKQIANYLMGVYNNMYMTARGFKYDIPQDETTFKAQMLSVGETVWNYATSAWTWRSRVNEVFRQYMSSIIVYASQVSTTFDAWYSKIRYGGSEPLFIPYSKEAFDAWTTFYNDPSEDGIQSFGQSIADWVSGYQYDFAYVGIPWETSRVEGYYNDFILNCSPVIYSNSYTESNYKEQCIVGFGNVELVDTLFIERSSSAYSSYKYGYSDLRIINEYTVIPYNFRIVYQNYNGKLYSYNTTHYYAYSYFRTQAASTALSYTDLQTFIDYVFNSYAAVYVDDIVPNTNNTTHYTFWYPFINHVILVDDLATLSNPEEVFNTSDFNIDDSVHPGYIDVPNGRIFTPSYIFIDNPFDDMQDIIDNSVDENGNQLTTDDFHRTIVNNTTINNYYVDDTDKINVPVEWFNNELTDQLAEDSLPFIQFTRDCISALGDLQIYIYGAIVIGLGGGILKKFLL